VSAVAETGTRTSAGDAFVEAAERALAAGDTTRISSAEIERVMTAAVRLYAAKTEAEGEQPPVSAERVTPTDIVVTVSAMLRAAGMNIWDLSMWFRRGSAD
jgi:hypothetical protein